jgi:phosphoheptose isomerase
MPVHRDHALAPATPLQQLPLRRVILYSNGVAYFERRGTVSGKAEVSLQFKQSQVDDVLKSMLVLDLGRGQIGAVSYNSSAPPSARLAEIPFSIEAGTENNTQGGLAGVLRQLQGERVAVTAAKRSMTGAILTVEERKSQFAADKPALTSYALVIATAAGEVVSFDLADVRSVRLVDEGARQDLTEFANASASARRRDAKTIVISSDGAGQREMVVSYTIAAPIWKTTYRVVLDSTGKPFFQGWAIVDNVGDEDWQDVSLSLFSGTPMSFIQPLQRPLYRYRPIVPIPEDLNLNPQVYDPIGGYGGGEGGNSGGGDRNEGGGGPGGGGGGAAYSRTFSAKEESGPVTTLSDAMTDEDSGITTAATGKEVGDLFEYRIDQPVTVRRDRSALIPILQTRMEGERVSIYRESERADRPMSGLLLKNTSALTLEGGSLTVIDGDAYAGESLIERLKPGEDRFISFAVDLATLVTITKDQDREPVFLVRVVNGTFQAHYHEAEKKTYTITNQTDKLRVVYVEHPLREGWRLTDETPKPVEKTQHAYRFRVELGAHETAELNVGEHRALMDQYAVSNLTPRELELFVSRRYLDETSRVALEKIISLKAQIAEVGSAVQELDNEAAEIAKDQARLRENIKALGQTADARQLIARYVAKANEQETRIEQLTNERRAKAATRLQLQSQLDNAIRALALDRKLQACSIPIKRPRHYCSGPGLRAGPEENT